MKNTLISLFLLLTVFTLSVSGGIDFQPEGWVLTDRTGVDKCIDTQITINHDKTYSISIKFNEKKNELSDSDKREFKEYPVTFYRQVEVKDEKDPGNYTITLKEIEKHTIDVLDTKTSTIEIQPLKELHNVVIKIGKESIWYNWTTNIITLTGEGVGTPGGDWDHSYGFDDLYDADQAGGWGVIGKISQIHPTECLAYTIDAYIVIGNSTNHCYFKDSKKSIIVERDHLIQTYVGFLKATDDYGHIEFGNGNITHKRGSGGVNFITYIRHNKRRGKMPFILGKDINLYGCTFQGTMSRGNYHKVYALSDINGNVFDCSFHQWYSPIYHGGNNASINQMLVTNCLSPFMNCNESMSVDNINVHESDYGIFSGTLTIRNAVFTDISNVGVYVRFPEKITLIDCELDNKVFVFCYSNYKVHQAYSFNLNTTPKAHITIISNETVLYNNYSFVNGSISEQIFTVFKNRGNIELIDNNPYTITIEKEGFQTYTQTINITKPFDCQINLIPIPFCDKWQCKPIALILLVLSLIFISIRYKSPLLSLMTGLYLTYIALSFTQTDRVNSLLLIGFALFMLAFSFICSSSEGDKRK